MAKIPKLGDYLLWEGKLCKIVGEANGWQVLIETSEKLECPHCKGDLGKHQFSVIVGSPLFQQNAEPVQTIKDEDGTTIIG